MHATFMPKPLAGVQGSGMHTHFSLFEGDTNAFHDPGDEHGLSKVARGFIAGAAPPRPRDHRGHQPVGQLLQAARRRLRGAGLRVVGPQQPLGRRQRARRSRRARPTRPASSSGRPTRPATRTSPSPSCSPPGSRASRRATTSRAETVANLYELHRRGAPGRGHLGRCPARCPRRSTRWSAPSSSPRRSASTSSSGSSATSGPSGTTTRPRSRQFELDRYLPRL